MSRTPYTVMLDIDLYTFILDKSLKIIKYIFPMLNQESCLWEKKKHFLLKSGTKKECLLWPILFGGTKFRD